MTDLTIIVLLANKLPKNWAEYHKKMLLEAVGDTPIITISFEPVDWGLNLIQEEYSISNIYRQVLRGAEIAETPYIAIADDDTLYPKEHFDYRPPLNQFSYNLNRWQILTWVRNNPFYFHKPSPGNGLMLSPRQLVIDALKKRFQGREVLDGFLLKELGTSIHAQALDGANWVPFYSSLPVVSLCHVWSMESLQQRRRKAAWAVQAYDIPKWRTAREVLARFE